MDFEWPARGLCGLSYPPGLTISGLLLIPLNGGEENDFLVFFRKGQLRHVVWAGYVLGDCIDTGDGYSDFMIPQKPLR